MEGTPQICGVLGIPTIHVSLHFKKEFSKFGVLGTENFFENFLKISKKKFDFFSKSNTRKNSWKGVATFVKGYKLNKGVCLVKNVRLTFPKGKLT